MVRNKKQVTYCSMKGRNSNCKTRRLSECSASKVEIKQLQRSYTVSIISHIFYKEQI